MERYQIILVYDGTGFCGFQRQQGLARSDEGSRTVQGVLERALRRIGWQGKAILAAGRTDSGVHASGQVAAFDLEWPHPLSALQAALNANLPEDMAVTRVDRAAPDFHPRFDAAFRRYRYRLFCQPVRNPLGERYAWRVWPAVSLPSLQALARPLLGTHDFAAFGTPPRTHGSTIRTVFAAAWQAELDGSLVFEVAANAFLYRMVRRLVAFQVAAAQTGREPQWVQSQLDQGPQPCVHALAPPQGLTLVEVGYGRRDNLDIKMNLFDYGEDRGLSSDLASPASGDDERG